MDTSVYVALSKQTAVENQLDLIANNLANANTTGFKSEDMAFTSYLQKNDKAADKTAYAKEAGTIRNTAQGTMEVTNNPLDLAIQGNGYFAVQTPQGERFTRAGAFMLNNEGDLVNVDGYQVLDQSGQSIQFQPEDKNIKIYADGRIQVDGEDRSNIGVFDAGDSTRMTKEQGNLYSSTQAPVAIDTSRIAQGMLENSNVNPILEMTKMIALQRDYERSGNFINSMYDLQSNAIQTMARSQ